MATSKAPPTTDITTSRLAPESSGMWAGRVLLTMKATNELGSFPSSRAGVGGAKRERRWGGGRRLELVLFPPECEGSSGVRAVDELMSVTEVITGSSSGFMVTRKFVDIGHVYKRRGLSV